MHNETYLPYVTNGVWRFICNFRKYIYDYVAQVSILNSRVQAYKFSIKYSIRVYCYVSEIFLLL